MNKSLKKQIEKAQAEMATWTPERRANVVLQGGDGSLAIGQAARATPADPSVPVAKMRVIGDNSGEDQWALGWNACVDKIAAQPPQNAADHIEAQSVTNDEVRIALDEMGKIADDPMWANHCEITKISLRRWVKALRGAYYKGYAEAGYDAADHIEAHSVAVATAHRILDELIDIYDDGNNNAPEDRCYVEGAWREVLDEARAYLKAPQSDAQSVRDAWISVDERLPEVGGDVLSCRYGNYISVSSSATVRSLKRAADQDKEPCNITHWQPLPAPPQKPVSDEVKP